MPPKLGIMLIYIGIFILIMGIIIWSGAFSWFGHLPGDIRIERHNTRIYFPITSMLLISVVISLLVHFIRRFFQ